MLYSFVVSTFNRPASLMRCLRSLLGLDFDRTQYEILVCDDGSSADYSDVQAFLNNVEGVMVRFEKLPHRGVSAARNHGIRNSRGSRIALIDDDFTLAHDYLSAAHQLFAAFPDARVLTFGMHSVGSGIASRVQTAYVDLVCRSLPGELLAGGRVIRSDTLPASRGAIIHRSVFDQVGMFSETLQGGEDGELTTRLKRRGIYVYFLPGHVIYHWEAKGFRGFLRQRVQYATNLYRIQQAGAKMFPVEHWGFITCVGLILRRFASWIPLAGRIGKMGEFLLLSPFLLVFLSVFYLTLFWNQLDFSAFRTRLARLLLALERRSPAGAVVLSRARLRSASRTAICLDRSRRVAAVYLRGSIGARAGTPLSDLDFAIVLKDQAGDLRIVRTLVRDFDRMRRRSLWIRDWWQSWYFEEQRSLIQQFWYVLDSHSWLQLRGERHAFDRGPISREVLLGTTWFQELMWLQTAISTFLDNPTRESSALRAAIHKTFGFHERLRFFLSIGPRIASGNYAHWETHEYARKREALEQMYRHDPTPERTLGRLSDAFSKVADDAKVLLPRGGPAGPPRDRVAFVLQDSTAVHAVLPETDDGACHFRTIVSNLEPPISGKRLFVYTPAMLSLSAAIDADPLERERPVPERVGHSRFFSMRDQLLYRVLYLVSYALLITGEAGYQERGTDLFHKLARLTLLYEGADCSGRMPKSEEEIWNANMALIRRLCTLARTLGDEAPPSVEAGSR